MLRRPPFRLRGSAFVVDWHNYGYSILAITLSTSHWVVRLSKWIELVGAAARVLLGCCC